MLVVEGMGGLVMLWMVLLLRMVMVVGLRLEFRYLHAVPLVAMATIRQRMLCLVCLIVHCQRVKSRGLIKRRGTRR